MAGDYQCPLGPQHCAQLDQVLTRVPQALALAKDCEDCGLPVGDFTQQLTQRLEMARKLKAKFFPHNT